MPKMKTLMADDDAPEPGPGTPQVGAPIPVRPEDPVPEHDLLQELAIPCEETVVRTDGAAPYVGFASPRSATWEPLRQIHPKIKDGTPFLGMSDGQSELADPLIFSLVRFKQFFSKRDDFYHVERVEFTDPGRRSGLTEEFLAVTVVHLGRRLVPTVSYFGGTKAGAVRKAADSLRVAGTPDWAQLSPAHAASANFPLPFGRFVTTVTIEPRTSRETGRQYQLAVGHVRPSNLEELDVLNRSVKDPDFLDQLRVAMDVFLFRLRNLEGIARGGSAA
jgi:hypothetical protein